MVSHLQRRTLVPEPGPISVNGQKGQPSGYQRCPKGGKRIWFLLLFRGLAPSGPIHQEQTFIVHQPNSRLQRKIAQALRKTEDDTGPIFVLSKYYVRQEIRIARNRG